MISPNDGSPSLPWSELPHENTSPFFVTTTEWCYPLETLLAESNPETLIGVLASFRFPRPSSPSLFLPKAQTRPEFNFLDLRATSGVFFYETF